jgi:hypothetical protein
VVRGLEERLLLSSGGLDLTLATSPAAIVGQTVELYPWPATSQASPNSAYGLRGITSPLSGVPALNSLPGAPASLYLDFVGDSTASYGGYCPGGTPAYDQDGDPTSFSAGELTSIRSIWSYVAEDYAPFNINVTTAPPASMAHGATEKVVIGGDGAWTGGLSGGLTFINDFTNSRIPNVAFVFADNLSHGNPRFVGDAISHEAGHGFGLIHQSTWSAGKLVQEYSTGPKDGTAPLMGCSYSAQRSLWWYGTSDVSSTTYQDDMAILAGPNNGFGYRPSTLSTLANAASVTSPNSNQASRSGLLLSTSQVDYFSFESGAGAVSFTVAPPASVGNLAPKVSIMDASGAIIASAGPSQNLSATVTATLPVAGSYRIAVASNGGYGNVGHYSLSGTVVPRSNPGGGSSPGSPPGTGTGGGTSAGVATLDAPSGLSAVAVSSYRIDIAWAYVPGTAGYLIEGSTDGRIWITLGGTSASVTSFSDQYVSPGTSRAYRVYAVGQSVTSAASAVAVATTPAIPSPPPAVTSIYLVSRAPRQVVLAWKGGAGGVQGYLVERSTNGRLWTAVGRLYGSGASFADYSVAPNKAYLYRVRSFNTRGSSSPSPFLRVVTPRAVVVPLVRPRKR